MWKLGQLPIPAEQLPTGTIIVHPLAADTEGGVALYARVSCADQKGDLDRQLARLSEFAASKHLRVVEVVGEIGSGLNGHRRAMIKILRNPAVRTIIVEHRDRLMRFGNPVKFFTVRCVTYGHTSEQRSAIIGDAVKRVMDFVVDRKKPVVIEDLNFQKKKSALEDQSAKYARMLSALSYTQIQTTIRARAFDAGIEVHEVHPAYTSVIGQYKFKDRYGLSAHNAAALVIGRRSLGFSETLPSQVHVTLPLSVRNRSRHVWAKWAAVSRKTSAALAARRQSGPPDPRRHLYPQWNKARLVIYLPGPVRFRYANRHKNCSCDVGYLSIF